VSDELHDTRPRWLRSLAIGVALLVVGILMGGAWVFVTQTLRNWSWELMRALKVSWTTAGMFQNLFSAIWSAIASACFFSGILYLTVAEGYPPADREDRRLRRMLRAAAWLALLVVGLVLFQEWVDAKYPRWLRPNDTGWQPAEVLALAAGAIALPPLPMLLMARLRGLAKRARSAHLAEHCMIVGIGTTLALLYAVAAFFIFRHGDEWFGDYWIERSQGVIVVMLILTLLASLFALWSLYLLIRFGVAFWRASRQLKAKWQADDHALPGVHAESSSQTFL
jgi:hypothetical protein